MRACISVLGVVYLKYLRAVNLCILLCIYYQTFRRRGAASVKQLQLQLQQSQQLADNYREQCISMEEELCKLREETGASKDLFKQRTDKMTKRLGLMNSRYETLEKRRSLEIEGYKNDIKLLRQRLKDVERQLYKVFVHCCHIYECVLSMYNVPMPKSPAWWLNGKSI